MPKLSDDTLLQRAINPALNDRKGFADACNNQPAYVDLTILTKIAALQGKRLCDLNKEEDEIARLTFIYATDWEISFMDSCPGTVDAKKAGKQAALFREVRIRRWGRTNLEAQMSKMKSVSIFDILSGKFEIESNPE